MNAASLIPLIVVLVTSINNSNAQTSGDYRSKQSGLWNLASSWQTYNGSTWIDAVSSPSSSNGSITVLSGHIITSNGSLTVDQLLINTGGILNITSGTFTVADVSGVDLDCNGTFGLVSGTLNGAGDVIINTGSSFNWTGGINGGTDTMTINAGATLTMNGGFVSFADTKKLINYGTWNWTSGTFNFLNGAPVAINYSTLNIYTDADITTSNSSTGSLINMPAGIINKIGSPNDETSFTGTISFINSGTVNINSSKIKFLANATNTGILNIGFGANLNFSSGAAMLNAGTSITGMGTLNFDGATAAINAAIISVNNINQSSGTVTLTPSITITSGNALNLSGGTLNATGNINFDSGAAFNWTGGTNGGSGTININAGAFINMNGNNNFLADTRTINNYGTWTWTSGTFYYFNSAPVVNNYGIFNISTDADLSNFNASTGTFINKPTGTINKIGDPANETIFSGISSFINEGAINVNSSKIKLSLNSINSGPISVAPGANMNFSGGAATLNAGTLFSGAGNLNFDGATSAINGGTFSISNINISGGTVTVTPSLVLNTDKSLNLSGGTLNGIADITFNAGSTFNWTGGTAGGSGIINVNAGAAFNMNGGNVFLADTKTLNNFGTWTWTSGVFYYNTGSAVTNNYGIFNINTDADVANFNANTGSFNNKSTGIINKTGAPADETSFSGISAFTNAGTININSGNITLNVGGTHTGEYNIEFGAQLKGSITMIFTGINFTNNGGVALTGLTFGATAFQYLNGWGFINTLTIANTTGVMLTETQTINTVININSNSRLTVYRDLIKE